VLVIWTDPVFGSMANVLSVFFVALADWVVWGLSPSLATYIGGALIFIAFSMMAYDTLGEKKE
jgi:drug/metabolite transporter (DMT)-like permease